MAKTVVRVKANFKKAAKAGDEIVAKAVAEAIKEGEKTAKNRIELNSAGRGYNLDSSLVQSEVSTAVGSFSGFMNTSGRIWVEDFWWRFFEYGTLYIPAMPFLRPAAGRAGHVFTRIVTDNLPKEIEAKAGVKHG
jgi:hypothetical protein